MKTFVVPDVHGRYDLLRELLLKATVINENDQRTDEAEYDEMMAEGLYDEGELGKRIFRLISIGDLANATLEDQIGDETCLLKARDWFDYLILGNHESGYLFSDMGFNGYHPAPHLRSLYNSLYREGMVVPAVLIGETLLTHAGVHAYFDFQTAEEAFDEIYDVWENYQAYETAWKEDGTNEHRYVFKNGQIEIPKSILINGVGRARGGSLPLGGIIWSDWDELKNQNFSQIVGHTPRSNGPILTQYYTTDVFTLNIDRGVKAGGLPAGVWLDEYGQIEEVVTVSALGAETVTT